MEPKKHGIITALLRTYLFSENLPYEARQLNAVYAVGIFSALAAGIVRALTGNNPAIVLIIFGIVIFTAAGMCLSNRLRRYSLFRWILLTGLCNVLFPCAFFALGGLESSMTAYFVLSILLVFYLAPGKSRVILLSIHTVIIALCYYLDSRPGFDWLFLDNSRINRYADHVCTVIITGLCIGFIFAFQKRIYFEEKEKAASAGKDLEQRNKLLEVVNGAAEMLLAGTGGLGEILTGAMELMARATGADRMHIWKSQPEAGGGFRYWQQYSWRGQGEKTLEGVTGRRYLDPLPGWDAAFSAGKYINGPVSSFPKEEQAVLAPLGICSILAIPVFLQEELWGFVSFDDTQNERFFSAAEISMLRSGSLLFANAIVRNQNAVMLAARMKQQELMAVISRSFLSKEPVHHLIDNALRQMGEFMELSRIVLAVPDKENGECHIVQAWFSSGEWRPLPVYTGYNPAIRDSFPASVPETGFVTAICCNDIQTEFGGRYAGFSGVGIKSFIWAPVYMDGAFWGLISVEECVRTRVWNESDVQLVGTVSSAITGAVSRGIIDQARTAALQQAVKASEAKGNFLANMSHEMRTPMNAIIGMTSIGRNAADIEKKDYAFEKIGNASSHLLGVINDILDMSKIEADKFELSLVSFDFEKMLQKAVNVLSFRMEERGQVFTVHIDRRIPRFLTGDDQRMTQVITNLLSNAVKFTPDKGSIRLSATLAGVKDGIYTIQTEVSDTGIGISPQQQAKLFTSFEQAESGTSRKFGGTGLGLVISKRIVELMGGRIWVKSELGKGSTFAFTAKVEKGHGASSGMLLQGVNIRSIRILAVDDNPAILEYFRDIMARFGVSCDTAAGAEEALGLIQEKGGYNLYFVDYKLPGMDGIALSRKIRERGAGSKVVMISSADWGTVEKDAAAAGVDGFLAKPLFPSPLADIINACLGSASVKQGPEDKPGKGTDRFDGYTMLLAEDVDINREIVLTLLEPTGLAIDCAENGTEAVRKFTAAPEKYSMIFMDVQMPEMDGYEATRRIRSLGDGWAKEIPIVAMTANVFKEDVERCLQSGMNGHVGKPLDLNDVLVKLRKYLPRRGGA